MVGRRRLWASAAILPLLALSGCEYLFEDEPPVELSVSLNDGVVAVANCDVRVVGSLEVFMGESTDEGFNDFFVAERDADWEVGEVVRAAPDEWTRVSASEPPALAADEHLAIHVLSEGSGHVARFTIPKRGLQEGAWLHRDGELTREPCG